MFESGYYRRAKEDKIQFSEEGMEVLDKEWGQAAAGICFFLNTPL